MEQTITQRVEEIARRVTRARSLELVHVEVARGEGKGAMILRLYMDQPAGITHDDCAAVSLEVGAILDVEDFISSAYTLEVSSPGLERGLYKSGDYERFRGHPAKIKTNQSINGQRNFRGRIAGVEGDCVVFDDRTNERVAIPLAAIAKANLEIDLDEEFRIAREREEQQQEAFSN